MRESNKRLLASEQKAREDNTRLRSHAKYLAAERDKWRQECQKQIDETMELVDQKDEAVREAEKQRNQFEVELALCRRDYQTDSHGSYGTSTIGTEPTTCVIRSSLYGF